MKIEVLRYNSQDDYTHSIVLIDKEFFAYGLEDEYREEKVMHETRIDAGTYPIKLRNFGGHDSRYKVKFGEDFHKGMLQVMDVPKFTDILIHIGNYESHTSGCLLVGSLPTKEGISSSTIAYKKFYPIVRDALLNDEPVHITYIDYDNAKN